MFIDRVSDDGTSRECLTVSVEGARHLVAALIAMIDEVDRWASKRACAPITELCQESCGCEGDLPGGIRIPTPSGGGEDQRER